MCGGSKAPGGTGIRTRDLPYSSRTLYQLSYTPTRDLMISVEMCLITLESRPSLNLLSP